MRYFTYQRRLVTNNTSFSNAILFKKSQSPIDRKFHGQDETMELSGILMRIQ